MTIPMTAAPVGHATAVKISKLIAQFLEITDDLDAFGEAYPFLRRDLNGVALSNVSIAWVAFVVVASAYIGFFANKSDPARRFVRRHIC